MKKIQWIVFSLFLVFHSAVFAIAVSVSPLIVDFLPGLLPRKDITVHNVSKTTPAYVSVDISLVTNPGEKFQKRKKIYDPEKLGLLATPNKIVIPPGGSRIFRLMVLGNHQDKERVYVVSVTPANKHVITHKINPGDKNSAKMGIGFNVGYGVRVTVRPTDMKPGLMMHRYGKQLVLENKGNTNVLVGGGKQCVGSAPCFEFKPHRIYPGNLIKIPLKYDAPVTVRTQFIKDKKTIVID